MHGKISVSARVVKVGQHPLVGGNPVRVNRVAADQGAQQTGLFGVQHAPQATFGKAAVADKGNPLHLGQTALSHGEHQINAVVRLANDRRGNHGIDPARISIGLSDGRDILFGLHRAVHPAGDRSDDSAQILIAQPAVTFDADAVDRRIFNDRNHQGIALRHGIDRFKLPTGPNALHRVIQFARRHRLAPGDPGIGQDGAGFDAQIARHLNRTELILLGIYGAGQNDAAQQRQNPCRCVVYNSGHNPARAYTLLLI